MRELDRARRDGQLQQLALAEVLAKFGEEGVVDRAGVVTHPALDEHHGELHAGFEVRGFGISDGGDHLFVHAVLLRRSSARGRSEVAGMEGGGLDPDQVANAGLEGAVLPECAPLHLERFPEFAVLAVDAGKTGSAIVESRHGSTSCG